MMDMEYKLLAEICVRLEYFHNSCQKLNRQENSEIITKIESVIIRLKETITLDTDEELTDEFVKEVIFFINSLQPIAKQTAFLRTLLKGNKNQLVIIINRVLSEIKLLNSELAERHLNRHHKRYLLSSDLFNYKCVFLYLKNLVMSPNVSSDTGEELQDAFDTLKESVLQKLELIIKNDLWLLGNHEFEKVFYKYDVDGDVQKLKHIPLSLAKKENKAMNGLLSQLPYPDLLQCYERLQSEESLSAYLQKYQPEMQRIYNLLNNCIMSLLQLYEHFDTEPLIKMELLEERDHLIRLLEGIHFTYDTISEGHPLVMDRCETLAFVDTNWPTRNYTIKTIHERGIKYRDHYIRKNLVTIYRQQSGHTSEKLHYFKKEALK